MLKANKPYLKDYDIKKMKIKDFQIVIDGVVKKLNIKKEELLEYMKQTKSK